MQKEICVLTGEDIEVTSHRDCYSYDLNILERKITIFICHDCQYKIKDAPMHIVKGLIANGIWPERAFIIAEDHIDNEVN
ncbi:hypothetical protein AHMF7605_00100 [Adhaeribacter arboris]|uniref:Uncharacterized protein n=1 Tax=Adhaeribacter arboris TaxID=2072846 RepID=A0A2T2Y928_9BACT|nr:hypothetical protein [Adhaeribacter arboris]PSR52031.1 hypothetical protein AHMF7605_00100 [Adhaeribacter arboris]